MKNLSVMLLNATLVLAVSNWAGAEPVADNPNPTIPPAQIENTPMIPITPNTESRVERRARQLPSRLQQMKESLNLTPEQQEAWQKFENTFTNQTRNILARSIDKNKLLTAPERLQRQIDILERRLEALKKISVVQESLYQILTPQQKQIMDNKFGAEPKPKIEIQPNPQPEIQTNQESPSPSETKIDSDPKIIGGKSAPPTPQNDLETQAPNSQGSPVPESKPDAGPESKPEVESKPATEKQEIISPSPVEEKSLRETEKTQD